MKFHVLPAFLCTLLVSLTTGFIMTSAAHAGIDYSGYLSPSDPAQWSIEDKTKVYIGEPLNPGTLTITRGASVKTYKAFLGHQSYSTGTVNVDGAGSLWTNDGSFTHTYIGYDGTGNVTLTNGGSVEAYWTFMGRESSGSGSLTVDGDGSSFTNSGTNFAVGNRGTGLVNLTNGGSLTTKRGGYIGFLEGATGTVNVDGTGSTWRSDQEIAVGNYGSGSLNITNGGSVSAGGDIRISNASSVANGRINVDGQDSRLTSEQFIRVAPAGNGSLTVTNGGTVDAVSLFTASGEQGRGLTSVNGAGSEITLTDEIAMSGWGSGSLVVSDGGRIHADSLTASVTSTPRTNTQTPENAGTSTIHINGENAALTITKEITLGKSGQYKYGKASMAVTSGGQVSAETVNIGDTSTVTVDADSTLKIGTDANNWTGTIDNDGMVRLVAGAGAASATYTPMSYKRMDGSGNVQALGGIWDSGAHTITVAQAASAQGIGGATAFLDLASTQRAVITDSTTGKTAGAAFLGTEASTNIEFTASAVSGEALNLLDSLIIETGQEIFSAWSFSVDGYGVDSDSPVYLSLDAALAEDILDLTVWFLAGGEWTEYGSDLGFDGSYANFTATELGAYAVTGTSAVPIPGAAWLLGTGLLGLAGLKRKSI